MLVGFGAFCAVLFVALRHRTFRPDVSFAAAFDAGLVALVAAVIGARLSYAALNAAHFADDPAAVLRLSAGGLNWHGAALAGMPAFALMIRWRGLSPRLMWDSAAWFVPVLMLGAWWGCIPAACGFGAEVETLADYPAFMVWLARDLTGTIAPRFATQPLGIVAAFAVWLALAVIGWRGWLVGRRFPFVLMLAASAMLALGFLRGDPAADWFGLRADQWLDVAVGGVAVAWLLAPRHREQAAPDR